MCFQLLGPIADGILRDIAQSRAATRQSAFDAYEQRKKAPALIEPTLVAHREDVGTEWKEATPANRETGVAKLGGRQGPRPSCPRDNRGNHAGKGNAASHLAGGHGWPRPLHDKPGSLTGSRSSRGITLNEALTKRAAVFEFRSWREYSRADRRQGVGAPQPPSALPLRL